MKMINHDALDQQMTFTQTETSAGQTVYRICVTHDADDENSQSPQPFAISWQIPIVNFAYCWHPVADTDFGFKADWEKTWHLRSTYSAPLFDFFDESGVSHQLVVLSDVVHDLDLSFGVHEESGTIDFKLLIPNYHLGSSYELQILVCSAKTSFAQAVRHGINWLNEVNHLTPMHASEAAYEPVFSTWYSFHQSVNAAELEQQLSIAKQMGIQTVITDDGWQTADNHRRYAYTGDWEPNPIKFPDMSEHVKRVHKLGFKELVWYSVPYVGKKSTHWEQFKHQLLYYDEFQEAGVLDPRYPDVRHYLVDSFADACAQWGLDGLKLDFIEYFRQSDAKISEKMDVANVQEAVVLLLEELKTALSRTEQKLIEFRQDYVGPVMQQYASMFRVKDCPNNYLKNRIGIVTMRLLCPSAAIHSDMLMWHRDDTPEAVALQLINCLFGVPQISVDLVKISPKQRAVLAHWLNYITDNRLVLQKGELIPRSPQQLYPQVSAYNDKKLIIVQYAESQIIHVTQPRDIIDLVNGTLVGEMVVDISELVAPAIVHVFDCKGAEVLTKPLIHEYSLLVLRVPPAGYVRISRD